MRSGLTITKQIHFQDGRSRRRILKEGKAPEKKSNGAIPRLSRLMALAIHMQRLLDEGEVADYADLALLGHVSGARITQIMNLLHLAPDIQEEILFMPPTNGSCAPICERMMRPITSIFDWRKQRKMWENQKTRLKQAT